MSDHSFWGDPPTCRHCMARPQDDWVCPEYDLDVPPHVVLRFWLKQMRRRYPDHYPAIHRQTLAIRRDLGCC